MAHKQSPCVSPSQRGRFPSAPTLPHSLLLRPNLSLVIPTPCDNLPLKRFHAAIAIVGLQRRCYCKRAGASARHLCRSQTMLLLGHDAPPYAPHLVQGLRGTLVFAAASPQHRGWRRQSQSANLITSCLATAIIFSAAALPPLINADLAPSACAIANMHCFERAAPGASLHWL